MATAPRVNAKLHNEELKDAYRVWLKDLYDDKPEELLRKLNKKKKSGSGRRARRNQRIEHAHQHTTASALKDVALKKAEQAKLPTLSLVHTSADKQALQNAQHRRHRALVDESNYCAFQYAQHPSWRPGLAFFQQLVCRLLQKPSIGSCDSSEGVVTAELAGFPVLVAPILLRVHLCRQGNGNHLGVALLYCQQQNQDQQQVSEVNGNITSFFLHCRVYTRASTWREHRTTLIKIVSNSSAEICAVRKCAETFESRNNELKVLRSCQEVEKVFDELWVTSDTDYDTDLLAIQKYIPFKGALSRANAYTTATNMTSLAERKAWIARCASRKKDKNTSSIWIISGGDSTDSPSTATTNSNSEDCQLVKCTIDQAWSEPRLLASMCTMTLEKTLRIRFNELVLDLLQDTSGTWWLLQVKAFTLASTRPASAATISTLSSSQSKKNLSRTQSAPTRFEVGIVQTPQWKKWRCVGRYCATKQDDEDIAGSNDDKEPCGYLTKKMLRSCEFYDDFVQQQDMSLAGGFTDFHPALTFHLQHRLPKRDRSQLYEPQPLCSGCVKRYHLLRQQWIETVEAPKATTTSNIIAGHRRKNIQTKMYIEHTAQTRLPPRKLPSLRHELEVSLSLNTSYSTPALLRSNFGNCPNSSKQEDNSVVHKESNYLDELAAMENMLAEHEPPSFLSKTKSEFQSSAHSHGTMASSSSSLNTLLTTPSDIFPKWDGVTRIEEMWQNLALKPLERQLTDPGLNRSEDNGAKQDYKSISLQQELDKEAKLNNNIDENVEHTSPEPKFQKKGNQSARNAAHTVQVQHCRWVFEDETYREDLVNDALSALRSGNTNVCFVVTPQIGNPEMQRSGEVEDELAEMALRSLYIDVKQAFVASSDALTSDLSLSSWPMRPKVCHETSGCITVKLGPA